MREKDISLVWSLFSLGIVAFFSCLVYVAWHNSDITDISPEKCQSAAIEANKSYLASEDFKIIDVLPKKLTFNNHLCIVLAGVAPGASGQKLVSSATTARDAWEKALAAYEGADKTQSAQLKQLSEAAQTASEAYENAYKMLSNGPSPIELFAYFSGKNAPQLTVKAAPKMEPQAIYLSIQASDDASKPEAAYWRDLLAGSGGWGEKQVTFGLGRTAASSPTIVAPGSFSFIVYYPIGLALGGVAVAFFVACLVVLARSTTILRESDARVTFENINAQNALVAAADAERQKLQSAKVLEDSSVKTALDATSEKLPGDAQSQGGTPPEIINGRSSNKGNLQEAIEKAEKIYSDLQVELVALRLGDPRACYSLARAQMAFWLVLVTAGFVFLWLTLGQYLNVINESILILLGINGATGLLAVQIPNTENKPAISKSFIEDILNEGDGLKLQRIQVFAWTIILGVIFTWNVGWNFKFVKFDSYLLLLIGIAQATYLGFKKWEKPTAQ